MNDNIDFTKWRLNLYKTRIDKALSNDILNPLKNKNATYWKYSSINKYYTQKILTENLYLDSTDTIVCFYKVNKTLKSEDVNCIYNISYITINYDGNIYINHVCPSGSLISKDGEYRSSILKWPIFVKILNSNSDLDKLYNYIRDYLIDKEIKIDILLSFPTDSIKNEHLLSVQLLTNETKIDLFVLSWFNFYYDYTFDVVSNNMNENYVKLMSYDKSQDKIFFKSIWKKFDIDIIEDFRFICSNNLDSIEFKRWKKTKIGNKIIPLSLLEAQNFFNIQYGPWKEYAISCKVSDLVINNITNGFALTNNWFILKIIGRIFDNPDQYKKMDRSEISMRIAELLKRAEIYTHYDILDRPKLFVELLASKKNHIPNEFVKISDQINNTIKYIKENSIQSNVGFNLITEYVGKTFLDSVQLSKKSKYYKALVSPIYSSNNYNNFKKYMFQLMYNIYLLNTKLHVIHGDIHMNNITLNPLFYKKDLNIEKDLKILYIIDGDAYKFDNNFYDLCIIDFSRSIINPEYVDNFSISISDKFPLIDNKDVFLKRQVELFTAYIYNIKPELTECSNIIEDKMPYNFHEYFKLFSLLDLYGAIQRINEYAKTQNLKEQNKSYILLNKILAECDAIFNKYIPKLINSEYDDIEKMEWPILTIIRSIFADDKITDPKDCEDIVDVYSSTNDIKYSLNSFSKFPPELIEDNYSDSSDKGTSTQRDKNRMSYANKAAKNLNVLKIIQQRQKEKNL